MGHWKNQGILISLLYTLLGIALLFWPGMSINVVCYVLGGVTVVYGIFKLISYFRCRAEGTYFKMEFVLGALCVIVGLVLLASPVIIFSFLPFVIGIFVLFQGLSRLPAVLQLKSSGHSSWWVVMIITVLTLAAGVVLLFNPFSAVSITLRVIGATLIIDGLNSIFSELKSNY